MSMQPASPYIIAPVVEEHAEEAAFLWLLRGAAVGAPHYRLRDICILDERVEGHIDGLRAAGESGWAIIMRELEGREPGRIFAAGVLALEGEDGSRLAEVLDAAGSAETLVHAAVAALGWVGPEHAERWLPGMLRARSAAYRRLGIEGMAAQRQDPGALLPSLIQDEDPATRAAALRAVGKLKRRDLLEHLRIGLRDDRPEVRFWASWAAVLLGDVAALETLVAEVRAPMLPAAERHALQLAFRAVDLASARSLIKSLAQMPGRLKDAIVACGVSADPLYVPWLIRHMSDPGHARRAGEAFGMITGADIEDEGLAAERPQGLKTEPTEDPADEDVELDPDRNLAWPDARLVTQWWEKHAPAFQRGTRYLCGRRVSGDQCRRVLRDGFQRQRIAAAYELALIERDAPLFAFDAPGFRQQRALGLGRRLV